MTRYQEKQRKILADLVSKADKDYNEAKKNCAIDNALKHVDSKFKKGIKTHFWWHRCQAEELKEKTKMLRNLLSLYEYGVAARKAENTKNLKLFDFSATYNRLEDIADLKNFPLTADYSNKINKPCSWYGLKKITSKEYTNILGLIGYKKYSENNTIQIHCFEIKKMYQNKGYGKYFFKEMLKLFFEVENVDTIVVNELPGILNGKTESIKRRGFWQSLGFSDRNGDGNYTLEKAKIYQIRINYEFI